ncbi:ribosomal protein L10 [Bifidobacterium gallicum DSM 20093 = LMG 11596]|uniref:Large ribosomal subunit protein uL10 n=2 Tax=Bifidobacterium gallicum DSM 20093 = LMG 11596 TaxID=561180 RepID=D1NVI0_9BIFI|nr:ribosomal protein L10 [Bifidobacterium gallicum DSM 20093 = LMG 11596]
MLCVMRRAFLVCARFAWSTADLGRNAMKRPEKEVVVAELTELFRNADAIYLTEYRGLTVPQISDLREKLGRDTSYTVAKNTLFRIAAKEAGIEGLDDLLKGPSAVVFVKGDFIDAAKTLRDFAKTNKALIIKGGFADGTVYDAEGAKQLADLKSRPELLAEFAGDIKASMAKAAYLFNALPTKAVRTIDALREKQEKAA